MKKILLILLTLVLCIGLLAACGGDETTPAGSSEPTGSNGTSTPESTGGHTPEASPGLKSAREYLRTLYIDAATGTVTLGADITGLPTSLPISGVTYTITWTVNTEDVKVTVGEDGKVTVDIDEKSAKDVPFVLTATIASPEGETTTLNLNYTVQKFKVATYAEFKAMEDDATVTVQGIVTGIIAKSQGNSSNCLYVQGTDGGFYIYSLTDDPLTVTKLEVGMEVRVTGVKDTYNGTLEITSPTVEVVNTEKKPATPVDYTDIFSKATDLKAEELVGIQAALVTIKGVEITDVDTSNGYYKFKLGNLESYVRISSSVCPMTKDDQTAMITAHTEHRGYTADVTGVICVYNGAFYLTPVTKDAFTNFQLPSRTDAEKVELEKGALTLPTTVTEAGEITVPTTGATYSDVKISWTSSSEYIKVQDGKLVVTMPAETTKVTVTATLTLGSETATVEFTVTIVVARSFVGQALEAAAKLDSDKDKRETSANEWIVVGKVTRFDEGGEYSEQYGNASFFLSDGTQEILVFRTKMEGVADVKVGDVLALKGKLQNYGGTLELVNAVVYAKLTSLADAAAAGVAGTGVAGTVIYGQIKSIDTAYSEQYGNITVTLTDGENDLSCYQMAGGKTLTKGQYILVTGTPSSYSGTAQMAKGATYIDTAEITSGSQGGGSQGGTDTPVTPSDKIPADALTVSDLLDVDEIKNLKATETTSKKYMAYGKVTSLVEPAEGKSYYSEVYISDGTKDILIWTLNMGEGVTGIAKGDTIVVYGYIKNYEKNGATTLQFATANNEYVNCIMVVKADGTVQGSGTVAGGGSQGGGTVTPPATGSYWEQVKDANGLVPGGKYLVVFLASDTEAYVLNPSLLGKQGHVDGVLANGFITNSEALEVCAVVIEVYEDGYSIKAPDGTYMHAKSGSNNIDFASTPCKQTITFNDDGTCVILDTAHKPKNKFGSLRYNNTAGKNGDFFRYYDDGSQQAICLFRLVED